MGFTVAEKLQIAMICDLAKPSKERELDFNFIWHAVNNNDEWALHWKYNGLGLNVSTPANVVIVCDILEMWDRLEEGYEKLNDVDKAKVEENSYRSGPARFVGFDGNNETERMHIARLLVKDLDRWSRFKDRGLNSHMRTADVDDRMLTAWRPIWEEKTRRSLYDSSDYDLSADDIAAVMRERIYPEYRKAQRDGRWTFDQAKMAQER